MARPGGVAGRFGQAPFHNLQCVFVPPPWLEMIRNRFGEVDHDAKYGAINRGTDHDWAHGLLLGVDRASVDAATPQARRDQRAQPPRQAADIPRRQQHWQERNRTDQEQKRLPIHDDSIDVPVAERRVITDRNGCRRWQQRAEFLCRPKYHHARCLTNVRFCRLCRPSVSSCTPIRARPLP